MGHYKHKKDLFVLKTENIHSFHILFHVMYYDYNVVRLYVA